MAGVFWEEGPLYLSSTEHRYISIGDRRCGVPSSKGRREKGSGSFTRSLVKASAVSPLRKSLRVKFLSIDRYEE